MFFFLFKQKRAYEVRIRDWSSDVCSSDLGPNSAIASVLACGVPMVLWSVFVDKVHRNPSTGIDWAQRRPWRETLDISLTKLAGLWATWGLIALIYATMRYYWEGNYAFSMNLLETVAPWQIGRASCRARVCQYV